MTCSSEITIGGHEFDEMRYSYTVWEHFKPEDRVIRTRAVPVHPRPDIAYLRREFVYSITADVLRRRLARAGFNWTTLEQEFQKHYHAVCRRQGTLFFNKYPDAERALARAEAFRAATLNDWIDALAKTVEIGVTRAGRNAGDFAQPKNILVDIISGSDAPEWFDCRQLMPQHCLYGFPCSSLNNMAVAMLEVVRGDALCEQEVTLFVEVKGDMTFDDMRLLKKPSAQYDDI